MYRLCPSIEVRWHFLHSLDLHHPISSPFRPDESSQDVNPVHILRILIRAVLLLLMDSYAFWAHLRVYNSLHLCFRASDHPKEFTVHQSHQNGQQYHLPGFPYYCHTHSLDRHQYLHTNPWRWYLHLHQQSYHQLPSPQQSTGGRIPSIWAAIVLLRSSSSSRWPFTTLCKKHCLLRFGSLCFQHK